MNRAAELERLEQNFRSGQSSIVIAPRRWGKTVLVHEAARRATERDERLRVVHLDLTTIRDEEAFARQYLRALINDTENVLERKLSLVREFLSQLVPRLKYTVDQTSSLEFALGWEDLEESLEAVLDLPERIAERRGLRIVIAIDEFQEVMSFRDGFDALLRAKWQHHRRANYCLYGSKYHMMSELFGSYKRPFYHFGDVLFLDRIAAGEWVGYLESTFRRAGREITRDAAHSVVNLVEAHSHYVQRLAMETYAVAERTADEQTVAIAYESMLRGFSPIFEQLVNPLSQTQLAFLLAVGEGVVELSSAETRHKYRLGSSSNVTKLKRAMQDREFVYLEGGRELRLLDPVFGTWLARRMGHL